MTASGIFQLCNMIALVGWLILLLIPIWSSADKFIIGIIIILFSLVYGWLLLGNFSVKDMGSFGSLDGVRGLFDNPRLLAAGWVHYLAFDLLTGIWIMKNGEKFNIRFWLILPCLLLTFMLGPLGLLLYILIRYIRTGNYFATNY